MMTDSIADMLSRIRNASMARLDRAELPASKLRERLAEILKREGYLADFRVDREAPGKLTLFLRYGADRRSAIHGVRRTSRPGRRVYVGHRDIPEVHNGLGVAILSTSSGVMTDREARERKVGGELICEVW